MLLGLDWEFYFCLMVLLVLLIDLSKRYKQRAVGIDSIYVFRGILNFPTLACISFISSIFIGWSGWIFGIIASIAFTEEVKIIRIDNGDIRNTDFFNNMLLRLLISTFLLFEVILIGCLFRFIVNIINNIY